MTESRKLRKERVTDLSTLGLETGKLYTFKGKYRLLYSEQKPDQTKTLSKIRTNDHLMFLGGDLWKCDEVKSTNVWHEQIGEYKDKIRKKGIKILGVKTCNWNSNFKTVTYQTPGLQYSGMIYVGFGDKFGWLNIVQVTKEKMLKQFEQVKQKK